MLNVFEIYRDGYSDGLNMGFICFVYFIFILFINVVQTAQIEQLLVSQIGDFPFCIFERKINNLKFKFKQKRSQCKILPSSCFNLLTSSSLKKLNLFSGKNMNY